jgi:hypothetical protein
MALGVPAPMGDIGPALINWDPAGADVDLFPTFGVITVKQELTHTEVFEDGHGDAPVDSVDKGRVMTVEADFTRLALAQLEVVVPGSTAGVDNLAVPNKAGNAYYASAKEIIVKPLLDNVENPDTATWWHFFKAYPFEVFEVTYDKEGQRIFHVVFVIYPDDSSGSVGCLCRLGPA